MKEPDVSGWSREELETAYKQMAKNCAARGQSLAYAQKQIEGMKQDAKQIIEEVREYLQKIGLLEKLEEYRLQMIAMTLFVLGDVHGVSAVYERTKLFYPCDPYKNVNCRKTGCHINGGECWQTSEKAYRRDDA